MLTQIAQIDTFGELIAHQFLCGQGEEYLSTMSGTHEAGDAVDRSAEVIAFALYGGTGMQSHTYTQRLNLAPVFGVYGALGGKGSVESIRGSSEGGVEGIATGLEDVSTVSFDGLAQKDVVTG